MKTSVRLVISLVAVAALATAAGAWAAIPAAKARAAAAKAGANAARQTHAKGYRLVSCQQKTARRDLCKVKLSYATGAKTCVLDVNVFYKSRKSTQLEYSFGQTLCS